MAFLSSSFPGMSLFSPPLLFLLSLLLIIGPRSGAPGGLVEAGLV
jgi:hypothetical protein